ncbi:MAG: hypothetical protein GXO75_09065, partial [Calditrichaeota bacterium]|nr:hypothetical protein [Calditrichota bacterium]
AHKFDLGADLKISQAVDYLGQPIEKSKIMFANAPVYLTLASPLPSWLQRIIFANDSDKSPFILY